MDFSKGGQGGFCVRYWYCYLGHVICAGELDSLGQGGGVSFLSESFSLESLCGGWAQAG